MKRPFYILSAAFFFACSFLFALPLKAQSLTLQPDQVQELKLTLDLASMELKSLQTQLAISQEKLTLAYKSVDQLSKELSTAKRSSLQLKNQRDEYLNRSLTAEKRRRNSTIAGLLFGITIGAGATLATTGAIIKSQPLAWTGAGIGGTALLTWLVGYCLQVW